MTPHKDEPAANPQVFALRQRAAVRPQRAASGTLAFDTLYHYKTAARRRLEFRVRRPNDRSRHDLPRDPLEKLAGPVTAGLPRTVSRHGGRRGVEPRISRSPARRRGSRATRTKTFTGSNVRLSEHDSLGAERTADDRREPIVEPITGKSIPLGQPPQGLVPGQRLAASGKDCRHRRTNRRSRGGGRVSDTTHTVTPGLSLSYDETALRSMPMSPAPRTARRCRSSGQRRRQPAVSAV